MIKMKDVADRAGVSISSVSLVLSGRAKGRINPELAEEIRRIADELGYRPNQLARSLRTRQTHTIGLVADQVATVAFAGQMIAGAQHAAHRRGYLVMLIDTAGDADAQVPATRALLQRDIDGLILASDFHQEVEVPPVPDDMPVALLDGRPADPSAPTLEWVVPDEEKGSYQGTMRLLSAGHRRIAFVTVPGSSYPIATRLRRRGYEAALEESGTAVDPGLIVPAADPGTAAGVAVARRILARPDRPTAVFCFSDQIAFGFFQVAAEFGLRIPQDLSVLGFDDQRFIAEALSPGLTTIKLPHRVMGEWAAERILDRLAADEPEARPAFRGYRVPCPLVERGSIAPPGAG